MKLLNTHISTRVVGLCNNSEPFGMSKNHQSLIMHDLGNLGPIKVKLGQFSQIFQPQKPKNSLKLLKIHTGTRVIGFYNNSQPIGTLKDQPDHIILDFERFRRNLEVKLGQFSSIFGLESHKTPLYCSQIILV